ncbi:MAG: roadblock/LC7 domain-containing protein [Deltaproteobacteria bacterium]|nr:MAG: roadblock/LC7 domain-containing protein [Deltaproteobacteria bacterium]
MAHQTMVLYEQELQQMAALCKRLLLEAHAKAVLLVDKNGQFITSHGDTHNLDTTSLASLTAGNIAATSGLARLIGEEDFPNVFHEGARESLHLSLVAQRAILVVVFDKRSSLGLVRLRIKRCLEELATVFATMVQKAASEARSSPFDEITDHDIDNLFGE